MAAHSSYMGSHYPPAHDATVEALANLMRYAILIVECNECGHSIEMPLNYVNGFGYQEPQDLESQLERKGWVYDFEAGSFCSSACLKKATKGRKPIDEIERL